MLRFVLMPRSAASASSPRGRPWRPSPETLCGLIASLVLACSLVAVPPASAQSRAAADTTASGDTSGDTSGDCEVGDLDMSTASLSGSSPDSSATSSGAAADAASASLTEAEARVQDLIAQDGVHVVHFWAPWCPNSTGELADGWSSFVERHEDVTFTFVTVRNGGEDGAATLREYNVPNRVTELTHPSSRDQQTFTFLDRPVTWIPTTWIFHDNGTLAFAMNYGEMSMDTLDRLVEATQKDW